jgi:hypothetical protein
VSPVTWLDVNERAGTLNDTATAAQYAAAAEDAPRVLRELQRLQLVLADLATETIEVGLREGHTQKALAEALGIPASTLRGAKAGLRG